MPIGAVASRCATAGVLHTSRISKAELARLAVAAPTYAVVCVEVLAGLTRRCAVRAPVHLTLAVARVAAGPCAAGLIVLRPSSRARFGNCGTHTSAGIAFSHIAQVRIWTLAVLGAAVWIRYAVVCVEVLAGLTRRCAVRAPVHLTLAVARVAAGPCAAGLIVLRPSSRARFGNCGTHTSAGIAFSHIAQVRIWTLAVLGAAVWIRRARATTTQLTGATGRPSGHFAMRPIAGGLSPAGRRIIRYASRAVCVVDAAARDRCDHAVPIGADGVLTSCRGAIHGRIGTSHRLTYIRGANPFRARGILVTTPHRGVIHALPDTGARVFTGGGCRKLAERDGLGRTVDSAIRGGRALTADGVTNHARAAGGHAYGSAIADHGGVVADVSRQIAGVGGAQITVITVCSPSAAVCGWQVVLALPAGSARARLAGSQVWTLGVGSAVCGVLNVLAGVVALTAIRGGCIVVVAVGIRLATPGDRNICTPVDRVTNVGGAGIVVIAAESGPSHALPQNQVAHLGRTNIILGAIRIGATP